MERVAKAYVHPDRLAILVVGKETEFEKPLSTLGTVTPIDSSVPLVTSPPTIGAPQTSTASAIPSARAWRYTSLRSARASSERVMNDASTSTAGN